MGYGMRVVTILFGIALLASEVTRSVWSPAHGVKHVSFTNQSPRAFTFSYPANWNLYRPPDHFFPFDFIFAYVGNVRLFDPCTRTPSSLSCSPFPGRTLVRGGVIASWDSHAMPGGRSLNAIEGIPMTLAVGPAKLDIRRYRAFDCPIKTELSLAVFVHRTNVHTYFRVTVCLRAPDVSLHQQQVIAMLNSLHNR